MDSVDKPVPELSPRVTKTPKRPLDTPRKGVNPPGNGTSGTQSEDGTAPNETTGRDLAHAALEAAKAKAKERGTSPGYRRRAVGGGGGQNPRRRRWSGPGADARDPQPLGRLVSRLVSDRGWSESVTTARVFAQWAKLVGEDVAEHAQPVALKDGELTVRASSTAWATQLRLLQGKLLAKIAAGVGNGVVKRMRIQGPMAPSWRKGPRHVSGPRPA